jgi:hypothetical protein
VWVRSCALVLRFVTAPSGLDGSVCAAFQIWRTAPAYVEPERWQALLLARLADSKVMCMYAAAGQCEDCTKALHAPALSVPCHIHPQAHCSVFQLNPTSTVVLICVEQGRAVLGCACVRVLPALFLTVQVRRLQSNVAGPSPIWAQCEQFVHFELIV